MQESSAIYQSVLIIFYITSRRWFSLICDETSDDSGKEQLCVTIRSVNEQYQIHEDVLGLYEIHRQDAITVSNAIVDVLTRCGLSMSNCRGQGYDGASAMAGHHSGVAAILLEQQPKAAFIHCNCHCLDLAIQDLCHACESMNAAINGTRDIVTFFRRSPKRLAIVEELSQQTDESCNKLKALYPTRWTIRAAAMRCLLKNYGHRKPFRVDSLMILNCVCCCTSARRA